MIEHATEIRVYYKGKIYYETRQHDFTTWEIWIYDLITTKHSFVINGANPFMFDNILFYQTWNGKDFDMEYKELG